MSTNTKKMTEGSPSKLIIRFAIPLMLGNMLQQAYMMADTLIVSRTLGVNALAALGTTDWLSYMMISVIQAITQGFAILMAQDFGKQDYNSLQKGMAHAIRLAIVLTVVITGISVIGTRFLLSVLGTNALLMDDASAYLRIIYMGLPAVMLLNFGSSVLRAFGNSKTPLYAVGVSATLNIGLDILFVAVLDFGVQGAACATVIAQLLAGIYCCIVVKNLDFVHIQKTDFAQDIHLDKVLLGLSWPLMMQNLIISVGGLVVQSQVNQYDLSFVAGYTATNKLYGMLEMAATAYGFAMVTYIGQNYGAGLYRRLKKGLKDAIWIAVVTSLVITVLMIVFGRQVLGSFLTGDANEVAAALDTAYRFLCIMAIPLPVLYILYITRSTLQGIGNTFVPMLSGIGECVARIIVSVVGGWWIGSDASLFAEPAAWFVAMVMLSYTVIKELKKLSVHHNRIPMET